jgi:CheY-like chemotaxis protein
VQEAPPAPPAPPAAPTEAPYTATGLRVLLVEDNPDSNSATTELLGLMGHEVTGVTSAEAALALPGLERVDVLFTDINLPGMSGVELARTLLDRLPRLRVVFASGYGSLPRDELGFDAAFLTKPYELAEMRRVLDALAQDEVPGAALT